MANYGEAEPVLMKLRRIIKQEIEANLSVRRSIKVNQAIVVESRPDRPNPDTEKHTVWVKLSPFDTEAVEMRYAPKIPLSELQPGNSVSYWSYLGTSSGIVMQDSFWMAYGQDDLEALASGDLSLIESVEVLADVTKQLVEVVNSLTENLKTANENISTLTENLKTANESINGLSERVATLEQKIQT